MKITQKNIQSKRKFQFAFRLRVYPQILIILKCHLHNNNHIRDLNIIRVSETRTTRQYSVFGKIYVFQT